MTITVNGSRGVSARLVIPWRGPWFVDVDLDPTDATSPPSGRVSVVMLGATLSGTVDPRGSGRMVASNRLRIVAGAGGWDKPGARQGFHNDAGVSSSQVYAGSASAIGEKVNDPNPITYGPDFAVTPGPASLVFRDRDWFVDVAGVTQVISWPAASPDASVTILNFDADAQRLELSTDALVFPGTTFSDPRFDGTLIARDIEINVAPSGARALVWCSSVAVSRITSALTNMVRQFAGVQTLRSYRYRMVTQSAADGRVMLQAVNAPIGEPDMGPISDWTGMQGDSATYKPGSWCSVAFFESDPSRAYVCGWQPGSLPSMRTVDASAVVKIGPSAPSVQLAGGLGPLVLESAYASLLTALATFASAMSTAAVGPLAPMAAPASALGTALAALPPPGTTKVTAT